MNILWQNRIGITYARNMSEHLGQNPCIRWEENNSLRQIFKCIQEIKVAEDIRRIIYTADFLEDGVADKSFAERFTGGGVVDLVFDSSLPWILFRADIDALPIQDQTSTIFTSTILGKMHACGHHFHSGILLGAFYYLVTKLIKPTSNIRFVWQRAEENPGMKPNPRSGGDTLVQEMVLKDIQKAYMLHIWSPSPCGTFLTRPGKMLGNSDRWIIRFRCKGGHVALPHHGNNANRIARAVADHLDSLPQRLLGPLEPWTLEQTYSFIGTPEGTNIMPALGEMRYGVRTMLAPEKKERYFETLEKEVQKIVQTSDGASVEFERLYGHPALINDHQVTESVISYLRENGEKVEEIEPMLGGEDFAYYLQKVTGCAVMLGAYQVGTGYHHQPLFNPNPDCIAKGIQFWLLLATQPQS